MPCLCRVLAPGRYADGTRLTAGQLRDIARQGRAMLAAGRHIPVAAVFPDAVQLSEQERLANLSRFNMGFVTGLHVDQQGTLWATVDAPDPENARRLRAARSLAAELNRDHIDGSGRKWPGLSLGRLALKMAGQPTRLSLDAGAVRTVRLSMTDLNEGTNMADRGDREQNDIQLVRDTVKALRAVGVRLPPGVDPYRDLNLFLIALQSACLGVAGADADDETEGDEVEVPPVAMSMDRRRGRGAPVDPRQDEDRRRDAQRAYREARGDRTVRLWDQAMGRGPNRGA